MFDEARLDDVEALERLDAAGTLRALATAGAQVRQSMAVAQEAGLDRLRDLSPRGVVVAAEGGSAAVADIFEAVSRSGSAIPVQVCSSGPLPGWVGAYDLVIAVSLSGRAPDTLSLAAEAARRGASLLTVGGPDSPLADVSAKARGVHVPVHSGVSSRTSVWGQVTPVLLAADAMDLAAVPRSTLESMAQALDSRAKEVGPFSEAFLNPAKMLATEIAESIPIILGSGPLGGVASRRAAAMFGRTGRVPVAAGALPDAASQIVACFDGPLAGGEANGADRADDIFADPFLDEPANPPLRLILLSDDGPDGEASKPVSEAVVAAAEDAGVRVSVVEGAGSTPLARLASHVALTDFAATYLALGHGFDPSDSPHVRLLRRSRS